MEYDPAQQFDLKRGCPSAAVVTPEALPSAMSAGLLLLGFTFGGRP
jgi:hypothetical protein